MGSFKGVCAGCGGDPGEYGLQPDMSFRCLACKIKLLGRQPRCLTTEEVRQRFLDHVQSLVHYWEKESRAPSLHEKMEGLAFSMLVMLDGEAGYLPGFIVAPRGTKNDQKFHKSIGEDWWPYVPKDVENGVKSDIAGCLHDQFSTLRKIEKSDVEEGA